MTMTIPVREGFYRDTDDGPSLLAGRCARCSRITFPRTEHCLECGHDAVQPFELGGKGELLCATVVHMGNGRFSAGYGVGYVMMPHGVRVFSQLAAPRGDRLPAAGTPMRLEIAPLWREGEQDVLAYRFVPTSSEEAVHA